MWSRAAADRDDLFRKPLSRSNVESLAHVKGDCAASAGKSSQASNEKKATSDDGDDESGIRYRFRDRHEKKEYNGANGATAKISEAICEQLGAVFEFVDANTTS